ncbi:ubiquitin-like-specific protease 1D isoform X2 [Manihot esculenta]|uniref:Ubiquitin-like protease family profile domain-containing protein n=3 Tax=Manihot esculenta TaxID=3983 RepID=A0A2C9UPR7_MANES|nr:ubiquitin-like-specific protease 1D isoform X2 [Manihot esculenta]
MEKENSKKRPLDLDWNVMLDSNADEPPPILIVKGSTQLPKPSPMSIDYSSREDYASMTDRELEDGIKRHKVHNTTLGPNLPDKGEKLRTQLKALEDEYQRRKLPRHEMDVDVREKPAQLTSSDGFKRKNVSSEVHSQSEVASIICRKMEENTDRRVVKSFDEESTTLSRCDNLKMRTNGASSKRWRKKGHSSSKKLPFQCNINLSHNEDKHVTYNSDRMGGASSTSLFCNNEESFSKKKDTCQIVSSNGSRTRKGQTVVLVDEDETQLAETIESENKLAECMKDATIYYPSRDDPESVEICYSDINCLAPEGFLTSPIMNFYIRYLRLQISPSNKATCDYHFFNTFFYKKLKQAVSYKGSDKESFFLKFRRWWKGVNIFQKAYVFIPIHEDLHWSLVIICVPDKADELGPIILHLDSLGLHSSKSVFGDIRSYLREEWSYMNQEVAPADLPIADKIWKHLPRRIDEKKIEVPQQKNEYDCGLFVLFFMERFIEEAPARLKKKDLAMFGKRWFRPEQASGLRAKIQKLLSNEFHKANEDRQCLEFSPSLPGDASS